ncbi:hypothetical protein OlV7_134 [Ostreococcus lucimarinus virus 7]|jgi:hypothetical protein|uniref:hypothetical protein n=1 Tax=Ostreococcus lucimarinus virus 1 TaxID=880162 RepID=UPI0001EF4613|nr:hypothetical protein OlV1_142 [Ostreococcus lucimarinus virus 1]YP_009173146.1 hypothetical protein AP054_gp134 [Ostreococcus lucimarinus virus 7]AET84704.1 hypothetical protein OLOG_00248 [Ostreococcus lucimarinus virus OlV4]ADQ91519.1 hypothetical protein OlV1_142 [Ostreococcus lucimarinus virus 1]ALI95766.1 hypothetical protein OlV7_134 [Ostreococcus lucimarinus virus 7]QBP06561.1 hypothetical protein OlV1_gene109 [Ostreococcus lucimarinus virus 1]QBP06828.1 hypothetical protein OlV7_ge
MLNIADFDEAYNGKPTNVEQIPCQPPACFVGSYAPVSKPGEEGRFFNNTYLLQKDRKFETFGTVKVTSGDLEKCRK